MIAVLKRIFICSWKDHQFWSKGKTLAILGNRCQRCWAPRTLSVGYNGNTVYVDRESKNQIQDGSMEYPFSKISQAKKFLLHKESK